MPWNEKGKPGHDLLRIAYGAEEVVEAEAPQKKQGHVLYVTPSTYIRSATAVTDILRVETGWEFRVVASAGEARQAINAEGLRGVLIRDLALSYHDSPDFKPDEIPEKYRLSSDALTAMYRGGLEVIDNAHQRGLPVLVNNVMTSKEVERKAIELGATRFIHGMLSPSDLVLPCKEIFCRG